MKKLEQGPFLYLCVQSLETRAFTKQVSKQLVQSVLTCCCVYFDSHFEVDFTYKCTLTVKHWLCVVTVQL